jgi:hypothetical protein
VNRSRYESSKRACGAAYTATGIRTPAGVPLEMLLGLDSDPDPIHLRVPGTEITYCGIYLPAANGAYIPPEEWDDPDLCPACLANEVAA